MKPKQILILGAIFLLLVAGVAVKKMGHPPELAKEEDVALGWDVDLNRIKKIEIRKGKVGETLELYAEEGSWRIKNLWDARADAAKIFDYLHGVGQAAGELRAEGETLLADFGLDVDSAFHVGLKDEKDHTLLQFLIGTKQPDWESAFVRMADSNKVYLSTAPFLKGLGVFGPPDAAEISPDFWADLQFAGVTPSDVTEFEIKKTGDGSETVAAHAIRSHSQEWRFAREDLPFSLDPKKISEFLESLSEAKALKTVDPGKAPDFTQPFWQMNIKLANGKETVLKAVKVFQGEVEAYFFQSSGQSVPFEISGYSLKKVDVDDSYFFKTNPLDIQTGKIQKIMLWPAGKQAVEILPLEDSAGAAKFVKALRAFSPVRILPSSEAALAAKTLGNSRIEIEKQSQAEPLVLEFGDLISEKIREYPVRIKGYAVTMSVFEDAFNALFGNSSGGPSPENKPGLP